MKEINMQNSSSNQKQFSNIVLRAGLGLVLLLSLTLAACGFQLRGVADLSFKNLYIQGAKISILRDLKQSFKTNGIQIVENAEDAELLLDMMSESFEKRILSLSGGGLVREYELNYHVNFRTRRPDSPTWSVVQTVQARRDISYNDTLLLSKLDEENMLVSDMHKDVTREVLRRLTAIKPVAKN
jgi:LPS-assembly lipoprotein